VTTRNAEHSRWIITVFHRCTATRLSSCRASVINRWQAPGDAPTMQSSMWAKKTTRRGLVPHLIREFRTQAVNRNGMSLISCIYALHRVTALSDFCLGAMSARVWCLASSDVNTYLIKEPQIVSAVHNIRTSSCRQRAISKLEGLSCSYSCSYSCDELASSVTT
jgi:hypothetical protein